MTELDDLIFNAGTELSRGDLGDGLSKVLRALVVLVREFGSLTEHVRAQDVRQDLLERRVEKLEGEDRW